MLFLNVNCIAKMFNIKLQISLIWTNSIICIRIQTNFGNQSIANHISSFSVHYLSQLFEKSAILVLNFDLTQRLGSSKLTPVLFISLSITSNCLFFSHPSYLNPLSLTFFLLSKPLLHYLLYTHLLHCFLKSLYTSTFTLLSLLHSSSVLYSLSIDQNSDHTSFIIILNYYYLQMFMIW